MKGDGMRAVCPRFKDRVDWKGESYIRCGGRAYRFVTRATRDAQYKDNCCKERCSRCVCYCTSR